MSQYYYNIKYYSLLRLLSHRYNWTSNRSLKTSRDYACMMIRVHGSSINYDMYKDILNDLIKATENAKKLNPQNFDDYILIENRVKRLNFLKD